MLIPTTTTPTTITTITALTTLTALTHSVTIITILTATRLRIGVGFGIGFQCIVLRHTVQISKNCLSYFFKIFVTYFTCFN